MSLEDDFKKAADAVNSKSKQSNDSLLKIYSLYKQSTTGDVSGKRPGMLDLRGRAKFDAWNKLKGTDKNQAMQDYIDHVASLS